MVWAALGFFGAITTAVNYAWRVEKQFGYWKHKLVSFLMLVAAGLLMVIGLLLLSARSVGQATWFARCWRQRAAARLLRELHRSSGRRR